MAPTRLAFVMTSFEPGGTERQVTELIRRLDRAEWAVRLVCFRTSGAWFPRALERTVSVTDLPVTSYRRPAVLQHLSAFARWCRSEQIDVVHTWQMSSNIFGLIGAAWGGVPVRIGSRRDIDPGRKRAELIAQRASYACAHTVVANCDAAAERLVREGVARRKIAVIRNGVDDTACGVPVRLQPPRRVIVVANLRPEKGHDVLIDAASAVLRRFPDARFEIVGDGPERSRLIGRAAARGVAHAFAFTGYCDNVPDHLAAADLFVLPSRSEALPNAVLEAQAAGLAVIASDVGGVRELIAHGRSGLLVPPGRPDHLAEAVCELMARPSHAAALAIEGRGIATRHSFETMVDGFQSLYRAQLHVHRLRRERQHGQTW